MSKDWTGNGNSVFKTLAASNHSSTERQPEDYYATDPRAAELLLKNESFDGPIWECACGEKHLSNVFTNWGGYDVRSSDLYDRCGNEVFDFLSIENTHWDGNIITNPPYKFALDFVYKALQIVPEGKKVCMFLKIQFLEGKARRELSAPILPRWSMYRAVVYYVLRTEISSTPRRTEAVPWPTPGLFGRKVSREIPL